MAVAKFWSFFGVICRKCLIFLAVFSLKFFAITFYIAGGTCFAHDKYMSGSI